MYKRQCLYQSDCKKLHREEIYCKEVVDLYDRPMKMMTQNPFANTYNRVKVILRILWTDPEYFGNVSRPSPDDMLMEHVTDRVFAQRRDDMVPPAHSSRQRKCRPAKLIQSGRPPVQEELDRSIKWQTICMRSPSADANKLMGKALSKGVTDPRIIDAIPAVRMRCTSAIASDGHAGYCSWCSCPQARLDYQVANWFNPNTAGYIEAFLRFRRERSIVSPTQDRLCLGPPEPIPHIDHESATVSYTHLTLPTICSV